MQGNQVPSQDAISIPRPAQVWLLCRWGLSPVLQAAVGMAPDLRSSAWVVPVGSVQASLSTRQPKYLTHDLHPNPLSCLTFPLPDLEGGRTKLAPSPHSFHSTCLLGSMPPLPLTITAAQRRPAPIPRSSPELVPVLREGVRQCLRQQCEQTVRILHAKVAQKSYGNEKR